MDELVTCACGCNEKIFNRNQWGYQRKFKHGHNRKIKESRTCPLCNKQTYMISNGICNNCNNKKIIKQRREQSGKIPCKCGCNTMIYRLTSELKPAEYANGHNNRGRKGINHPGHGYKFSKEQIEKRKLIERDPKFIQVSKPEKLLLQELDRLNILYIKQKYYTVRKFVHPVDIFIPPKTVIEVDGEYYHSRLEKLQRDFIIDIELEKKGLKVKRFWTYDIYENLPWVMNQILYTINKSTYKINDMIKCSCGCGEQRKRYDSSGKERRYIKGHVSRTKKFFERDVLIDCQCGCGEKINKFDIKSIERRFKFNHQNK